MEVNTLAGKVIGMGDPGVTVVLGSATGNAFDTANPAGGVAGDVATTTKLVIAVAGSVVIVLANAAQAPPETALSRR